MSGYPACAGIDPFDKAAQEAEIGLPRMRGDRPNGHGLEAQEAAATPHARGSTAERRAAVIMEWGYPACAGIDLPDTGYDLPDTGLPRMRGDRPSMARAGA